MWRSMLIIAVAACARLPHLEPETRDADRQAAMVAVVESSCVNPDPFAGIDWPDRQQPSLPSAWDSDLTGTGVVLSERHVLTAAHVVYCPNIPVVHVTVGGRRLRAVVTRDDAGFGSGRDLARLVIMSAETFGLGAVPPTLGPSTGSGTWCAATRRGWACGYVQLTGSKRAYVTGMSTRDGDSGAGVYDELGRLVGVVSARSEGSGGTLGTYVATVGDGTWGGVDQSWLEGT